MWIAESLKLKLSCYVSEEDQSQLASTIDRLFSTLYNEQLFSTESSLHFISFFQRLYPEQPPGSETKKNIQAIVLDLLGMVVLAEKSYWDETTWLDDYKQIFDTFKTVLLDQHKENTLKKYLAEKETLVDKLAGPYDKLLYQMMTEHKLLRCYIKLFNSDMVQLFKDYPYNPGKPAQSESLKALRWLNKNQPSQFSNYAKDYRCHAKKDSLDEFKEIIHIQFETKIDAIIDEWLEKFMHKQIPHVLFQCPPSAIDKQSDIQLSGVVKTYYDKLTATKKEMIRRELGYYELKELTSAVITHQVHDVERRLLKTLDYNISVDNKHLNDFLKNLPGELKLAFSDDINTFTQQWCKEHPGEGQLVDFKKLSSVPFAWYGINEGFNRMVSTASSGFFSPQLPRRHHSAETDIATSATP